jgi:hypothetical protein
MGGIFISVTNPITGLEYTKVYRSLFEFMSLINFYPLLQFNKSQVLRDFGIDEKTFDDKLKKITS